MKGKRSRRLLACCLAIIATTAFADSFTWTGNGNPDFDWSTEDNWTGGTGLNVFPDDTGDDATFPSTGAPWTAYIVSQSPSPGYYTIDDLTINGGTTFDDGTDDDPELHVDSVVISGSGATTTVSITGGAKIFADGTSAG